MRIEEVRKAMARITTKQIAKRLIEIAKMPGTHGMNRTFICADLVDQECLYDIQDALMKLIDQLDHESAARELPFMYQSAEGGEADANAVG